MKLMSTNNEMISSLVKFWCPVVKTDMYEVLELTQPSKTDKGTQFYMMKIEKLPFTSLV